MTVRNKIANENSQHMDQEEYKIDIHIYDKSNHEIKDMSSYKLAIFECTSITYNSNTGRVNGMTFKLISE